MAAQDDVIQEIIRQGERLLAVQLSRQESVERRTAELLRLAVATVGGIVVVSGLLLTTSVALGVPALLALALGVLLVALAAFLLARILVGLASDGALAFGPNLRKALQQVDDHTTHSMLARSVAEAMPDWLADNEAVLARQRESKLFALSLLAAGSLAVLLALVYIVGGHILV